MNQGPHALTREYISSLSKTDMSLIGIVRLIIGPTLKLNLHDFFKVVQPYSLFNTEKQSIKVSMTPQFIVKIMSYQSVIKYLLNVLIFLKLFSCLCRLQITFANNLDPDHAQQNVGPDLGPNCLKL